MSKKEYILMILQGLEKVRPLAKDLKRFVLLDKFDDQTINGLTDILKQTVNTVIKESTKKQMQKSIELLEKLKQMEHDDELQNLQELKQLESNFNNL